MSDATLVYPHQLFEYSPALDLNRPVYIIEEPLLLTHNGSHRQKLLFHKLSLDSYELMLRAKGYTVTRISLLEHRTTENIFATIRKSGITTVHIVDTTDDYLEQAIAASGLERVFYDSPLFILSRDDAKKRYLASKKFMASFYKRLRQDKDILIDENGEPVGGTWSFDADNRKKLPKNIELPTDFVSITNEQVTDAIHWVEQLPGDHYGEATLYVPYTHETARVWLEEFLNKRFAQFGTYEDAIHGQHTRLFHSSISPLLNVGLLTPQHVIDAALNYYHKHNTPIDSVEGFIRQIIGWREFIRASYETDGRMMRSQNFWEHTRTLPTSAWHGTTGVLPVDSAIKRALQYGYTHHIERLMVMGNFFLLTGTHPDEVYRWFMGLFIDAYDWVMVPNVYGMSQFADGGSFATKPYIGGGNYIRKMSSYPLGEWEEIFTALYWNFIATHHEFFATNHRLSMMPRLLDAMDTTKRKRHIEKGESFLDTYFTPS